MVTGRCRCRSGPRRPGPCPPTRRSPSTPTSSTPWCRPRATAGASGSLSPRPCSRTRWRAAGVERHTSSPTVAAAAFEGLKLRHPFYDREVPVILGEHVTLDAGTGAVHTAPGHGVEDYIVGRALRPPGRQPGGGDGRFLPETPLFAGQHVLQANAKVIEVLKARGMLVQEARLRHSYPHCWRHKTPIIFRATPQWFIGMEQTGPAGARPCARSARWVDAGLGPGAHRGHGGQPPRLVHLAAAHLGRADHPVRAPADRRAAPRHGAAGGGGRPAHRAARHRRLVRPRACGAARRRGRATTRRSSDTLDVWFDSGVTHACVLEQRAELTAFPATCTSRARTSTAAGSSRRCSPRSRCTTARRTGRSSRTASRSTPRAGRCPSRSATSSRRRT